MKDGAVYGCLRWFIFMMACMTALIVAMTAGFILMRNYDPVPGFMGPEESVDIQTFRQEAALSQRLAGLMASYLARIRKAGALDGEDFRRWREHEFQPALTQLRQRMLAVRDPGPRMTQLLDAANKAADMARTPQDHARRIAATEAVLAATSAYEGPQLPDHGDD